MKQTASKLKTAENEIINVINRNNLSFNEVTRLLHDLENLKNSAKIVLEKPDLPFSQTNIKVKIENPNDSMLNPVWNL